MSHIKTVGQDVGQHKCKSGDRCDRADTLWAVLEHSSDGIFIVDVEPKNAASIWGRALLAGPDFRLVAANPACKEMLSMTADSLEGLHLQNCLPGAIARTTTEYLMRCLQQRQSIEYEATFNLCKNIAGNAFICSQTVKTRLSPVLAPDGTMSQIIGLCQDLTERRRSQAEAQLLQTIALAIAQAEDFHSALSVALRYCCEATGWNYGEAWIPNTEFGSMECSPAWYSSNNQLSTFRKVSQGLTFPLGIGIPGRVWLRKQSEWHWDVSHQPDTIFLRAGLARDFGLRSGLGIPILANDLVIAVFVFFMFESCEEDRGMVDLVSAVAAQLGTLMQRKQAEAALRESQRKLAHLIDSLPGIVFSCGSDREWSMLYLSEGCLNLTGYTCSELAGNNRVISYNSITHPEDLPKVLTAIEKTVQEQKPYVVEYRIRTKSGQEKWLWEKGNGVFSSTGEITGLEGFITDITELKQAEKILQYRVDFEQLIAIISTHFINLALDEIDSGINKALENIGSFCQVDRCYIFLLSENGKRIKISHEWRASGIEAKTQPPQELGVEELSCFMEQLSQQQTINISHVADLPSIAIAETKKFQYQDVQSAIAVPMVYRESLMGFLAFESVRETKREAQLSQRESPKPRPEDIVTLLKIVGEIFVNALDRKRAEEELRQAETKYHSIFDNAVEGIFQTTPDGHYLTANPMLAQIYGYDSPEQLMNSLTDIQQQLYVNPNRRSEFMRLLQQEDAVLDFESEIYRKDGSAIWICENARAIRDGNGALIRYEGTVVDISKRKQAEAELHKRDNLLQGVATAMNHLLIDPNHRSGAIEALATLGAASGVDRVYICENHPHPVTGNVAMSMQFEWTREAIAPTINKPAWQNLAYGEAGLSHWYDALSNGQTVSGHARDFPPDVRQLLEGDEILSILMVPILVNNQFWGYIGFDDCQSERNWSKGEESILVAIAASIGGALLRYRTEALIRHQAFHDRLTGLPNRQLLDERLPALIEGTQCRSNGLAVMFLDLDRFKIINDTLGHAIGDRLLKSAASRIRGCLREDDTIVRWGGDEFILLLPQISCSDDAANIAGRILEALRPAFELQGHQLYITGSIGIALYPLDGSNAETLIKNADTALYRAKEQGRNNYQLYAPGMNSGASELLNLDNSLHHALERGEFLVYYQPQINVETGAISRMEALVRWQHPTRGMILPSTFISLAEDNGLIVPLGEWVLQTACAQTKAWIDRGIGPNRVAVNLSARQFQQPGLVEMVTQVLKTTGLNPNCLELEITETTAMQNVEFTSALLGELQNLGVNISMDDFGIGYASLSGLKNFPFHTLKIDRAFVRDLTNNPSDCAIVQAIVALGHALNLTVVAEGVETEAQRDLLRNFDCTEMQGYLFSKPLCASDATHFLHNAFKSKLTSALST